MFLIAIVFLEFSVLGYRHKTKTIKTIYSIHIPGDYIKVIFWSGLSKQ